MGTMTMLTLGGLLAPLQEMLSRMVRPMRRTARTASAARGTHAAVQASCALTRRRPLRVVHVADASRQGARTGRLVISGRMADVCAELERLAALEATAA